MTRRVAARLERRPKRRGDEHHARTPVAHRVLARLRMVPPIWSRCSPFKSVGCTRGNRYVAGGPVYPVASAPSHYQWLELGQCCAAR